MLCRARTAVFMWGGINMVLASKETSLLEENVLSTIKYLQPGCTLSLVYLSKCSCVSYRHRVDCPPLLSSVVALTLLPDSALGMTE